MQKIVLIHGMSAPLDDCFGKELKNRLQKAGNYQILEPIFAIHPDITLDKWFAEMDKIKPELTPDTIFVCHSLGTNFILKYLHKNQLLAKALVCVAGGVSQSENVPENLAYLAPFIPNDTDFDWAVRHAQNRYNIFNADDYIWKLAEILEYNDRLKATAVELPYGSHFGRKSGVKDIPELFEIIKNNS